jgi:hypothetical protein
MPHTTHRNYKTSASDAADNEAIARTAIRAIRALKRELNERAAAEAVLRGNIERVAHAAAKLIEELDASDEVFQCRVKEEDKRFTPLDAQLHQADSITVTERTLRCLGMAAVQLRSIRQKFSRDKVAADELRSAMFDVPDVIQTSVLSRREAYVIGPNITPDEWGRLEQSDEASAVSRLEDVRGYMEVGVNGFLSPLVERRLEEDDDSDAAIGLSDEDD